MPKEGASRVVLVQRVLFAQLVVWFLATLLRPMWQDVRWLSVVSAIFVLVMILAWVAFVAWAFVHCAQNEGLSLVQRAGWCAAIVLANAPAAWLYAAKHAGGAARVWHFREPD